MELIGEFLEKLLVSKIKTWKRPANNTGNFIDEKDNDVTFLTNTASWCTFIPAAILFVYKLGLKNGGYVGERYTS